MKKQFLTQKGLLSVSLIVLSIAAPVNFQLLGKAGAGHSQVADGVPLPIPPTPPPKFTGVLVADGVPLPIPPTPPPKSANA
jgi:hypothetical protein